MSWRNQGITGSNNIPLGNRRRFGGGGGDTPTQNGGYDSPSSNGMADSSYKRGRSPTRGVKLLTLNVSCLLQQMYLKQPLTA